MSGHHYAVEDRSAFEVTHLALLGVKIAGPAFWGILLQKINRYKTQKKTARVIRKIRKRKSPAIGFSLYLQDRKLRKRIQKRNGFLIETKDRSYRR